MLKTALIFSFIYTCPAEHLSMIKNDVETIISVGIDGLSTINTKLATRAKEALEKKTLSISCSPFESFEAPIYIKKTIYLGSAYQALLLFHQNRADSMDGETLIHALFRHPAPAVRFNTAAVFHEFLHFAGADNLSTKQHNLVFEENGPEAWEDVVYSCTEAVYPTYGVNGWFKDEEDHNKAVETCKNAGVR